MVIENQMKDTGSISGGSRPETPGSKRHNEMFANTQAIESGSSQEDDFQQVRVRLELELGDQEDLMPHADKHMALYEYVGSTDIELHFRKGAVVQVLDKCDGWWQGVNEGQVGWFPESYMDPVPLKMRTSEEAEEEVVGGIHAVEKPRNMDDTMASSKYECHKPLIRFRLARTYVCKWSWYCSTTQCYLCVRYVYSYIHSYCHISCVRYSIPMLRSYVRITSHSKFHT